MGFHSKRIPVSQIFGFWITSTMRPCFWWWRRYLLILLQISQKEKFLGWYTTGSSFKSHDTQINEVFAKYTESPVFLVVDVEHYVTIKLNLELTWVANTGLHYQIRSKLKNRSYQQIIFPHWIQSLSSWAWRNRCWTSTTRDKRNFFEFFKQ